MERLKRLQGFASLSIERRREIARQGGLTAAKNGTAHRWTAAEASEAGSIGGQRSAAARAEKKRVARADPSGA